MPAASVEKSKDAEYVQQLAASAGQVEHAAQGVSATVSTV